MTNNPRNPVIVGVGQFIQRTDDFGSALEPVAMMAEAVREAAADAGADASLADVESIRVVDGAWPYNDPGKIIATMVGASPRDTALSPGGGNSPQSLVNGVAAEIAAGDLDVAVVAGGEGIYSRRRARRNDIRIPYTDDADVAPARVIGEEVQMSNDYELARGFEMPVNIYPTFESAVRHSRGETLDEHRDRISGLWADFNEVAVANPYAWSRTPMTAAEIREPSDTNRMVGFPYTKAMNSNWDLDQAAAILMMSAEAAERAGVPRDRWVFLHAGTDSHDTYVFSERDNLHSSPAIRVAGRVAFELAGVTPDDVAHIDIYSCFPSAVQISATELGISLDRRLTQTGGLTFAGGPLNNYVTHGIASLTKTLREHPGEVGVQTANGGYVTKHAIGVYSTEPPAEGFRHADVQDEVDTHPRTEVAPDYTGAAVVEAYTVMHGREGAERALVAAKNADGHRVLANCDDAATMAQMLQSEAIGTPIEVAPDGSFAA